MKIIFCGHMYHDIESDIKKVDFPKSVSGYKYQLCLIKGLKENGQDVHVINIPSARYFPHYPKVIFKEREFKIQNEPLGESIGYVNIVGINYISEYFCMKKLLCKYIKANKDEKYVLVCFNSILPIVLSILAVQKRFDNVFSCSVIGDISRKYSFTPLNKSHGIKARIFESISSWQDVLVKKFDCFGFVAEPIADALNIRNKPFTIVEGMYSGKKDDIKKYSDTYLHESIIFYAGALDVGYGIKHLLNAFTLIDGNQYRLEIAGKGPEEDFVKECAEKDSRITYLGYLTPSEVEEHQKKASVLVNPRLPADKFNRYSFPSKTMESLASGKPYVSHKLPCYLTEYDRYIYYPENDSDEALSRKLIECCTMPEEERKRAGEEAKSFILREKNPQKQCKKLIELFSEL